MGLCCDCRLWGSLARQIDPRQHELSGSCSAHHEFKFRVKGGQHNYGLLLACRCRCGNRSGLSFSVRKCATLSGGLGSTPFQTTPFRHTCKAVDHKPPLASTAETSHTMEVSDVFKAGAQEHRTRRSWVSQYWRIHLRGVRLHRSHSVHRTCIHVRMNFRRLKSRPFSYGAQRNHPICSAAMW